MRQELWTRVVKALPTGMTVDQVARLFRRSPALVKRRLAGVGYKVKLPSRRTYQLPEWVTKADWTMPNVEIAAKFGVSRERVRQFRVKLKKPFVESRGKKANAKAR